jgi:P-type Mg2+ transporter
MGSVSSAFDLLTFTVLLTVFHAEPDAFRTAWFIESTQILVIFAIRTWGWTWSSRPDRVLTATSLATLGGAIAIALTPLGRAVGFTVLPISVLVTIAVIACAYLVPPLTDVEKIAKPARRSWPRRLTRGALR